MESSLLMALALFGAMIAAILTVVTLVKIYTLFQAHFTVNTLSFTKKFGTWAVITGSTDGIGRAYAFELAKRGINIVLVSRTQSKLDRVATELEKKFLIQTKTIAVDFSEGPPVYKKLEDELASIECGILVNNVGKQYDYPMFLTEVPEKELWDIININIAATTHMTRIILPGMVRRGKGAIVNISSGSEMQPLPLMTVYAASKMFVKSFSAALRCEYASQGITVQHIFPLFVSTKMNDFSPRLRKSNLLVPDADAYAAGAVNTLGRLDCSAGYWTHEIQACFISLTPEVLRTYIGWTLNSVFRKDYFQKIQMKSE